jgi:hypothetical protein
MGVGDRELVPEWLDRLNPKLVQKLIGEMGTIYGGLRARSARNRGGAAVPRDNERDAREYRDGTGRRNRRVREV